VRNKKKKRGASLGNSMLNGDKETSKGLQ
jgi:hypothetical protein